MIARTWPTSASSSSWMRISSRVPATGEGTSVSTLSVDTSTRGSSTATSSPTSLSQRVMVPSVTDSPRAGRVTSVPEAEPEDTGAAGASSFFSSAAGASSFSLALGASAAGASSDEPAPEPSPITMRGAPTSTSSSSSTRIFSTTPATGEGTSVSTLSVDTSTMGWSTSTVSPTSTSQRVTVPSVTDSPSAGSSTVVDIVLRALLVSDKNL